MPPSLPMQKQRQSAEPGSGPIAIEIWKLFELAACRLKAGQFPGGNCGRFLYLPHYRGCQLRRPYFVSRSMMSVMLSALIEISTSKRSRAVIALAYPLKEGGSAKTAVSSPIT